MERARAESFIAFLRGLASKGDRGSLAALRKGLTKPPGEAVEMYSLVAPYATGLGKWDEDLMYLVASLFSLHSDPGGSGTLGASLSRARAGRGSGAGSMDLRFSALLDSDKDALPNRLRQAVSLLRSSGVEIDYVQLLIDLSSWFAADKRVQRRWAADYYAARGSSDDSHADTGLGEGNGEVS